MKTIGIYLKTTETCNLNCKHCFTSGTSGAKVYWEPPKVIDWLTRLAAETPTASHVHLELHGGEPFLAPVSTMQQVYDECNTLWPSMSWGVTTNLTYKLTEEMIAFMEGPLKGVIGTSWDGTIRFATLGQRALWEKNVRMLVERGMYITLFVSVTKDLVQSDPMELFEMVKSLGVQVLSLERLTKDGSALKHPDIFPSNAEQDAWFVKMEQCAKDANMDQFFRNRFLEDIYAKFDKGVTTAGTFCRDCEQKLFTLNATGTIAGCPNSAPSQHFGHISDPIPALLASPIRLNNISCEKHINTQCIQCEVFGYCGGDCHQLEWEGNVCGAPKTLMIGLVNRQTLTQKIFKLTEI